MSEDTNGEESPGDEELSRAERIRSSRRGRGRRDRGRENTDTSEGSQESQTKQTPQTQQRQQGEQTTQVADEEESGEDTDGETEADVDENQPMDTTPQEPQTEQTPQTAQAPVTDRPHDTYYLPEDLRRELKRAGTIASLEFEGEFGVELEKNRHLRPLMLYLGMQRLREMSSGEVREVLAESDLLDAAPVTEEEDRPTSGESSSGEGPAEGNEPSDPYDPTAEFE